MVFLQVLKYFFSPSVFPLLALQSEKNHQSDAKRKNTDITVKKASTGFSLSACLYFHFYLFNPIFPPWHYVTKTEA